MSLGTRWWAASAPPGEPPPGTGDSRWLPAEVPGTAAGVLAAAGRWRPGDPEALDDEDWWFRTEFAAPPAGAGERVLLHLDGLATLASVWLNGELVLESESMWLEHVVDVGARLREGGNELFVRCAALAPRMGERRRPRARWRSKLARDGNLRWWRTSLLGRAPGFAPSPAAVGPWRPVRLVRHAGASVEAVSLRPRLEGRDGVLAVRVRLGGPEPAGPVAVELSGPSGTFAADLARDADADAGGDGAELTAELRVPAVDRWWPHTHGDPVLHAVRLRVGDRTHEAGRVGFRSLVPGPEADHDVEAHGLALHVNGVPVFARGAVWSPVDPVGLAPTPEALRARLELARDAGMNLLRIPGTAHYESRCFHDLCDELGLLVWQDLMFANLDYPFADDGFCRLIEREVEQVLHGLAGRPSSAVVCGSSEVEQQVAMLGLEPALARDGPLAPLVRAAGGDLIWVPSAPCGGEPPFRPDQGIANYYGVGGYRRPLSDARLAEVRFAAECLAFANVPDEAGTAAVVPGRPGEAVVHHPRWKAGVPRDAGSGWDFDDVRDHYLRGYLGVDPGELRRSDHERYLELSRAVTGEVMAEVFGEWRRSGSPCAGGLVLWLSDLVPGAGWGVVDAAGAPKAAYHHLRRAFAPIAVWTTDEGLGGVAVHVANDPPDPLTARLRVSLYADLEHRVEEGQATVSLPPHGALTHDVSALVGHWIDASWAYRFGPPAFDAIVVSLEGEDGTVLSRAVRFPAGPPAGTEPADRLGLAAELHSGPGGASRLVVRSRRLAYGVRVHIPGFIPDDDAFCVEPGVELTVPIRPVEPGATPARGALTALNLRGRVSVAVA